MGQRLASHVHVYDDLSVPHVFGPDDEVPDWARAKITNPAAWEPTVDPQDHVGDGQGDGQGDGDDWPTEEWTVADIRAWAELHDIDLLDATKKADILAVIEASR